MREGNSESRRLKGEVEVAPGKRQGRKESKRDREWGARKRRGFLKTQSEGLIEW